MSPGEAERIVDRKRAYVGKYRLLAEIGNGGWGDVYLAVSEGPAGFNKLVVLKLLRPTYAKEPRFRSMFLDEARLAARLNHPNVVQTNEVGDADGDYFIAMEYLEGQPLSRILDRARHGKPLPLAMHLRILSEALAGLHYAHELRDYDGKPLCLVHRDVTPHNLFLTYSGQVKLLDFGIAKTTQSSVQTETGALKGKIAYMAPEQLAGDPVDRRADVYSVGVMLWEAATGQRMWHGVSELAVINRIANGDIPSARSVNPDVLESLDRVCTKALAGAPSERYATAAELQADIEAILVELEARDSLRDAGNFIAEVFSDARDRMRDLVDEHLRVSSAKISFVTEADLGGVPPSERSLPVVKGAEDPATRILDGDSQLSRAMSAARGTVHRGRSWSPALSLGALAALLLIAGGAWFGRRRPADEQAAPRATVESPSAGGAVAILPAPASARPQASAEPPSAVHLRVTVAPANARVFIDAEPVAVVPYEGQVPRDGSSHEIRAIADGYAPAARGVTYDKDVDVALVLEKAPLPRSGTAKSTKTSPASAVPARPNTSATSAQQQHKARPLDTDVFPENK